MPVLSNPRHERFCQELAQGKTADEAYQLAGYKENRFNASRLKTNEHIASRLRELQAVAAISAEVTLESLIREAGDIQRLAIEDKQFGAANAALVSKAKLGGLWVEKTDNVNRDRDVTELPDEEITRRIRASDAEGAAAQANGSGKPH